MVRNYDLAVFGRYGQLTLIVEVKSRLGASPEWAIQYRRNILAHSMFPEVAFYLLALPDRFYLWKGTDVVRADSQPAYIIDPKPFLTPYVQSAGLNLSEISGSTFELLIAWWLRELVFTEKGSDTFDNLPDWIVESGLYDAVAGGHLEHTMIET